MGPLLGLVAVLSAACGQSLDQVLQPDPNLQPEGLDPAGQPSAAGQAAGRCEQVARSRLPSAFPDALCYPSADLLQVTETALDEGTAVEARWSTMDVADQVRSFYRDVLTQANWEVTNPADADTEALRAVKDGIRVEVAIANQPSGRSGADGADADSPRLPFTVSYRPTARAQTDAAQADEAPTGDAVGDADRATSNDAASDNAAERGSVTAAGAVQSFTDIDEAPEELQNHIRDLAALGILEGVEGNRFQPNEPATRRAYARWLFNANNRLYSESGKRIRAASGSDPAFQDLPGSSADFAKIQGLADAGLIPSPLSGNATAVTFRPDAPVTRETLIQWKVPLDLRQSLPNATLDAVQQAWGFQDAAKIDPEALRAVLADHANGDQSNIRRAFGFTTLFQPKKAVTRAEAAAVLWHFGYQGDGRSADQVLQGMEDVDGSEASQTESQDG
ncbi:MAG: S-layer homology domain-containing protein [Elainellaceae cyanobacterium]